MEEIIKDLEHTITYFEDAQNDFQRGRVFQAKKILEALRKHDAIGSLPSEIYATYDRCDGEIFCAFVDKEQCKREAEESGCGMKTVQLVGNDR